MIPRPDRSRVLSLIRPAKSPEIPQVGANDSLSRSHARPPGRYRYTGRPRQAPPNTTMERISPQGTKPVIGKQLASAEQTHGIGRIAVLILATVIFAAAWNSDDRNRLETVHAPTAATRPLSLATHRQPHRSAPTSPQRDTAALTRGLHRHFATLNANLSARPEATLGDALSAVAVERRDGDQLFTGVPAPLGSSCTVRSKLATHHTDIEDCPL